MALVKEKVLKLKAEIEAVCKRCGRDASEVQVLAATKYATAEQMDEAITAGIDVIGENRVQDAAKKFPLLNVQPAKHFIGHLQTNKVRDAVRLFDAIESVDSYRLAEMIQVEAERMQKKMPVLVEVNVAADSKKYGIELDEVIHFIEKISLFKYLDVRGLMAIVPLFADAEEARPYFKKMKDLFDECRKKFPQMNTLSMGMTQDFRVAIEEGSTQIRVGSYIFA